MRPTLRVSSSVQAHYWLVSVLTVLNSFFAVHGVPEESHWLTTWGCAPQPMEAGNLPPAALANSTLRQFVHVTVGGKRLRVRLSNVYGTDLVALHSAYVALSAGAGSAGNGDINT